MEKIKLAFISKMQKLGGIKQLKISVLRIFCLPFLKKKRKKL